MASQNESAATILPGLRVKQPWWESWVRFARRKPVGAVGGVIFLTVILMALFSNVLAPYDPIEPNLTVRLDSPSFKHPFGTDNLGRDVLSRVIWGSRVSLYVGIVTVVMGTGVGAVIGVLSGYLGGMTDLVVQRIIDGVQAFPALILALVIVTTLGPGLRNSIIAIGVIQMTYTVRVARAQTLSVKENLYVDAARSIGANNMRIMVRHILPNIAAPLVILASLWLASAVIIEASLSFLGLGAQPPTPSWGRMLSIEGRVYMEAGPWLAIFPGIAISVLVIAINFFGDALRDTWDPRLRSR